MVGLLWRAYCFEDCWETDDRLPVESGLSPNLRSPDFVCFLLSLFRTLAPQCSTRSRGDLHELSYSEIKSKIQGQLRSHFQTVLILNFSPLTFQLMPPNILTFILFWSSNTSLIITHAEFALSDCLIFISSNLCSSYNLLRLSQTSNKSIIML